MRYSIEGEDKMKKLLCWILTLTMLVTVTSCEWFGPEKYYVGEDIAKLIVHFIDVGQGDSALLESDGEFVLIDAGERDYGDKVLNYIKNRGADELKYVIATHPHSDHIGGMKTVINGIDAENFITVETDCSTYTWTKLLTAVDNNDINYIDAEVGDTYTFGEATFTIMGPLSDSYNGYNNYSVVTKVECGDVSFMLTGDAEKESEYEMVAAGEDLSADVLKCGHHGSSTSNTAKFLKAVNPAYAVISCGKNNDYGHPHKETMQKLNALGCDIFRTDTMGTIVACTDGKALTFSAQDSDLTSYTYNAGEDRSADGLNYIGNQSSHVFHYSTCSGAKTMNEKNKIVFENREDAIKAGYKPCSSCNP